MNEQLTFDFDKRQTIKGAINDIKYEPIYKTHFNKNK